jgi:hypothetical protein
MRPRPGALSLNPQVGSADEPGFDPFTEVMILLINVSSSRTHFGNLGQMNGASIVLKQPAKHRWGGFDDWDPKRLHFAEKVHHDYGNPK